MNYPKIEKDILIHTDRKEFKLYTDKVLIENLKKKKLLLKFQWM